MQAVCAHAYTLYVCACCVPACMHVCMCACLHGCIRVCGCACLCSCFSFLLGSSPSFAPSLLSMLCLHAYMHVCVHSLAPPPLWLQGITIPSQCRYVYYFGHLLQKDLGYSIKTLLLKGFQFEGIPNYNLTSVQGCGEWVRWGVWSGWGWNVDVGVHDPGRVHT